MKGQRVSYLRILAFLGVFVLLGSCGGGGGSGSTTPADSGSGGSTSPTQPTNSAPSFTSANTASVLEGTTAALTIEVSDGDSDDTISQSITGGVDADLFELGVCNASRCTSNTLSFKAAPNFEKPQDANADNDYVVIVQATDATDPVEQTITISVTNAVEGRIVDAPLSDATVCLDTNEDSECDESEPSVTSDSQGYYAVAETSPESGFELRVLSIGGTDTVTGKELPSLALIAEVPADPTQAVAVTPLSSVISVATDPQAVIVALGFPETVTPDELTSIDPWALASDSSEGSGEFTASTELAESIGITTAELETVADNVVTTSVQIANLIQTADSVVTDTTTSGIQSPSERAAMITATVTKELVETIETAVTAAGSAAATTIDLGDSTFTTEVLKETAEESATLIVAEIETKQNTGTLDLSDTNNTTVAAILEIKETQEVVTQTGLDATTIAAVTEVAKAAAETNTLIATQVATNGATVLTSTTTATAISEIVENNTTLATQLVTNEITTDEFTTQADVTIQASASGGLNEAVAQLADNGNGDVNMDDDPNNNKQIVTSDSVFITMPSEISDEVTLTISYQTNPVSVETTGLGIKMFFDSDKLAFASLVVDADEDLLQATTTSAGIQEDSNNLDTDALTDKFANIAYVSFPGEFSVPSTPLYRVSFKATDIFSTGSTQINFALITAAGFVGETDSVTLSF